MSKHDTDTSDQHAAKRRWLNAHEEGYHKAMGNRQVQMIAIGGAIGTGLFNLWLVFVFYSACIG